MDLQIVLTSHAAGCTFQIEVLPSCKSRLMKRAVSVSIGSSKRDKAVELELLGEQVRIERIGTDGDMEKAARIYRELDGKVDSFGVGGADLWLEVEGKRYPIHSVKPMFRFVQQTPIVDGSGLKHTLEAQIAQFIEREIGRDVQQKKVLMTSGIDRWGMVVSFINSGYECVFGDAMFALRLPLPIRSKQSLKILFTILAPIATRLPFEWLYPTGESQERRTPKWGKYYNWANVIAGDCHFVKRFMPDRLDNKIIATNTTTRDDVALFRRAGVRHLVTSTPVIDGRSFGTNMMEAALVAAAGMERRLTRDELAGIVEEVGFEPQVTTLNP